jgi:NADP-dependent 3-hydroxy acid dehydrogenase YdfG
MGTVRKSLVNRVALVTGASSGIGRATALALAREGARVALSSRNAGALEQVARRICLRGGQAMVVPADVTDRQQVERMVSAVLDRWGHIDILFANAGQYIRSPIRQLTVQDMERSMAINFYGALYSVLAVLPHMLAQRRGHIVLMSTFDAKKGLPHDAPYVAAKSALAGFGEVLRQELHGSGVHVTVVFPGRVDTPLIANLRVPWMSAKIPAESVARAIVHAIYRPRPEVIVPRLTLGLLYVNTISPALGDLIARMFHLEGWEYGQSR